MGGRAFLCANGLTAAPALPLPRLPRSPLLAGSPRGVDAHARTPGRRPDRRPDRRPGRRPDRRPGRRRACALVLLLGVEAWPHQQHAAVREPKRERADGLACSLTNKHQAWVGQSHHSWGGLACSPLTKSHTLQQLKCKPFGD